MGLRANTCNAPEQQCGDSALGRGSESAESTNRFLSEFYAILGDSVLFDIIVAGATEAISLPRLHGLFQQ